jgi:hypothetical protein
MDETRISTSVEILFHFEVVFGFLQLAYPTRIQLQFGTRVGFRENAMKESGKDEATLDGITDSPLSQF